MPKTWNNLRSSDDVGSSEPEPRTVPEAQRWLSSHKYPECTEKDAGRVLFMRRLVRDGTVSDD